MKQFIKVISCVSVKILKIFEFSTLWIFKGNILLFLVVQTQVIFSNRCAMIRCRQFAGISTNIRKLVCAQPSPGQGLYIELHMRLVWSNLIRVLRKNYLCCISWRLGKGWPEVNLFSRYFQLLFFFFGRDVIFIFCIESWWHFLAVSNTAYDLLSYIFVLLFLFFDVLVLESSEIGWLKYYLV